MTFSSRSAPQEPSELLLSLSWLAGWLAGWAAGRLVQLIRLEAAKLSKIAMTI